MPRKMIALALALIAVLSMAAPLFAADAPAGGTTAAAVAADSAKGGRGIGAGIAAGLAVIGAGIGIGLVGYSALAAIARQPEQKGAIQVNMIILAALVEGAAIIALILVALALTN